MININKLEDIKMNISIIHIVLIVVGMLVGSFIGWYVGVKLYEVKRLKRVLRAKNPELWDLEHFVVVDEETHKIKKRGK